MDHPASLNERWNGARGGSRTHNLQLRRLTLYPIELHARDDGTLPARAILLNWNLRAKTKRDGARPSLCQLCPQQISSAAGVADGRHSCRRRAAASQHALRSFFAISQIDPPSGWLSIAWRCLHGWFSSWPFSSSRERLLKSGSLRKSLIFCICASMMALTFGFWSSVRLSALAMIRSRPASCL